MRILAEGGRAGRCHLPRLWRKSAPDPPLEGVVRVQEEGWFRVEKGLRGLTLGTADQGLGGGSHVQPPSLQGDPPVPYLGWHHFVGTEAERRTSPRSAQGLGIGGLVGGPEALRPGWKGQIPAFDVITLVM